MQKKKRKLAVQISLIVTLMFILALTLIGAIVLRGTKRMFFQFNNEKIKKEMIECKYLLMSPEITSWVLEQWQNDPDMMLEPATEAEEDFYSSFVFSRFVAELDDMEAIESMDPETQRAYLKALFRYLGEWIDGKRLNGDFDRFLVLDMRDLGVLDTAAGEYFILMDCGEIDDKDYHYHLGTYFEKKDGYGFLSALRSPSFGEDSESILFHEMPIGNDTMYVAASPVYINGEIRYIVCMEYDYATFAFILNQNTRSIAILGAITLLAVDLLLILFIYFKAVHPLVQVNSSIHSYMETKDSAAAVQSMKKIRAKNEVGRLADSISAMAVEIERSAAENLRLQGEKQRVEAELDLAAKIQTDSLPAAFPQRPDMQLYASMDPAKEVGGDFYDFFFIGENRLGLVIADVSGKGVPAALFMMAAKNLIKNYAMTGLSAAEVLNRANESLCENNRNKMFVTVWFGILDLSSGHVTAANGGHEYPIIRKPGGRFELFKEKHGMMLGVIRKKTYTEYAFDLEPGSTLFLYTDGAPEATNAQEQLFGTERMLTSLNKNPDGAPEALLHGMRGDIDRFVGDAPQFDDLTMLCLKYMPNKEKEEQP